MSEAKNIKGIDEETWAEFKSLAAESKLKSADMFKVLVKNYKKEKSAWDRILNHAPIFSEAEYVDIEKRMKELRKERGWRV